MLVIVNVPSLNRPPPKMPFPSMMLRPDMLTTLSPAMLNTSVVLFPLIVTPAAGPVIVSVPLVSAQLEPGPRQRDRLCPGEDGRVEGDRLAFPLRISARSTAPCRSSSPSGQPVPSAVVLTISGDRLGLEGADVPAAVDDAGVAALVGSDTAGMRALLPASMAGCPAARPSSQSGRRMASGASRGLSGWAMVPVRSEPTQPELPSVSPIRLYP